ncbi:hypothetical protein ACSAZL_08315 [Methanosarcina sp. T3]|uniref:hypothetical protein n=1 Tax=Methanosarcina sp. T3 TaxID=3439062 RepID=UPI003F87C073
MTMKMDELRFIPKEFVFADIWTSDEVHTHLSLHQLLDTIKGYAPECNYDEKKKRIMLRNNFAMKIVTTKFATENKFSLEFFRYYHRFYAVYVIIAYIASFVVQSYIPMIAKSGFFALVIFMLPIPIIWMAFETIRGIKGIKGVDYSKEAERAYSEILNTIKEKEKELDMIETTDNI